MAPDRSGGPLLQKLSGGTRLFPIIGDPIKFVQSPQRLTRGFAARGHDAVCIPMHVAQGDLEVVMHGLARSQNVDGLLVTMPHKLSAYSFCATSTERAARFGAVSVMRRNMDGTWHGDMLDGIAFVKAQRDRGAEPEQARVLLIGAGGAGSAIAMALLDAGVRELVIHDAEPSRAAELSARLSDVGRGRVEIGPPDPTGCDMVCNATPMGLSASDPLPLDATRLDSAMFVGDVIAGHGVTPLLAAAQATGCRTADGTHMVWAVQDLMLDFMMGVS